MTIVLRASVAGRLYIVGESENGERHAVALDRGMREADALSVLRECAT